MDAGLEATTRFSTWSVAGIAEGDLDDVLARVSDSYCWDVLFLQETFRRTEGVCIGSGHMLYRTPAFAWGFEVSIHSGA